MNEEELRIELDTLEERRDRAILHAEACKRAVERKYNTKVRPRSFQEGDLGMEENRGRPEGALTRQVSSKVGRSVQDIRRPAERRISPIYVGRETPSQYLERLAFDILLQLNVNSYIF